MKANAKRETTGGAKKRKAYRESDEVRTMKSDLAEMEDELLNFDSDLKKVESDDNEKVRNEVAPAFRGIFGLLAGVVASCRSLQKGVEQVDRMMFSLCDGDDGEGEE